MPEAATNVSDLASQLGKMADQMERNEKAAKGIEFSFLKIASAVGAADILKDYLAKAFKTSELSLKVQQVFTEEKLAELGYTRNLVALQGAGLALAIGATRELYFNQRLLNQNLIEANASWKHRTELLAETLVSQAQLGISFGDMTKAAAALVGYSLDTESTFNDNVRLVAQMEQGLGVSVGASAQLASIVERQIKGSFTDVAHVVAQLVDDTALAGDEAVRLANAIATAMGRLRPGMSAQGLPEVVRLVGRYEAALKEVGGAPGAFQQLITSLTRPEGIVGAGALGVSPEFITTSQGVEQVMDRFARFGNMLVGQAQGWERQFRLQMLADVFGTSADAANQMLIAIQRAKEQQVGAITVQDRWREQMHATNSGVTRLANSLRGLMQGALLPVVQLIGFVTNKLADFVETALQYRPVVYGVMAALGIGVIALVASLWKLVRALVATSLSALGAATSLKRQAVSNLVQGDWWTTTWGRGGGAAAGVGRFGSRVLLGGLVADLLLALAPLGVAVGFLSAIYKVNKDSRDEQVASRKIQISMTDRLEASTRARIYAAVRTGKPEEEVLRVYKELAGQAQYHGDTLAEQKKWLDDTLEKVDLDVLKGITTAGMFTPLTERTPEQADRERVMRGISEKLLKVNEEQKAYMDKADKRTQANIQEMQNEFNKTHVAWRNPFNVTIDYWSHFFDK